MYGVHSATWKSAMAALWSWTEAYGDAGASAPVPAGCVVDGVHLSRWISTRRHDYRTGRLDLDQISQLEAVPGWSWGVSPQEQWATTYAVLCAYTAEHGTAHLPTTAVVDGIHLGTWASRQRSLHRHGHLPNDRATALQHLPGWVWTTRT